MNLLLARHGDTFEPQDPVVCIGSSCDLPLASRGIAQAHSLGRYLKKKEIFPEGLYCSPLQRTKQCAQIIQEELGLAINPTIDERLNELDYGKWTGLTAQELKQHFGKSFESWEIQSRWPKKQWKSKEAPTMQEAQSFLNFLLDTHAPDATVLAITSNGRLRCFLHCIEGALEQRVKRGDFKVQTGHLCEFLLHPKKNILIHWNTKIHLETQ
jgi:probable phosphoglycerate mutase